MFRKRNVKLSGQNKRKSESPLLAKIESCQDEDSVKEFIPISKKPKLQAFTQSGAYTSLSTSKNLKTEGYSVKERQEELEEIERRKAEKKELDKEIESSLSVEANKAGFVKPVSKDIRMKIITDYQPDVCKDFKKTGYCGYGDSCKFLHSRDDFAGGWKLNKDWNVEGNEKEKVLKELEEIPFKCVLCETDYKSPIVTRCQHYFCSSCFMKKMRESKACPVCGENTDGVAMVAKKLRALLNNRK